MTCPAIKALKEAAPDRHITLLTSAGGAEVAPLLPYVDEVMVYKAPWMKTGRESVTAPDDLEMIAELAGAKFDAAVIFTVYSQSPLPAALFCQLAAIPLRLAHCRENPYHLLTDWVPESEPHRQVRHEVARQLDLVRTVGADVPDAAIAITVPPEARARARDLLLSLRLQHGFSDGWYIMHPGASVASRRYSAAGFAEIARALYERTGHIAIFTGSSAESALVDEIRSASGVECHSLAGQLNLAEMAALLELSPLLICNNTGPIHLAAATGTPTVDLYALTNPQHGPWMVPCHVLFNDVPCRYCYKSVCPEAHHACLQGIPPSQVVDAAIDLLTRSTGHGNAPFMFPALPALISNP